MKFTFQDLLSKFEIVKRQAPSNLDSQVNLCHYGPTGSGKSSLICYELDYSKMAFSKNGCLYDLSHPTAAQMPTIGNSGSSQTELPSCFQKGSVNLIDLPGILDTNGSEQEIINAYTNSLIFKKGRSFKFMIVLEMLHFYNQRGAALVETISRLEKLLGADFPYAFGSCYLVVSKHNAKGSPEEDILGLIEEINNGNSGLKAGTHGHNLVKAFLEKKQIIFYSIPNELTP